MKVGNKFVENILSKRYKFLSRTIFMNIRLKHFFLKVSFILVDRYFGFYFLFRYIRLRQNIHHSEIWWCCWLLLFYEPVFGIYWSCLMIFNVWIKFVVVLLYCWHVVYFSELELFCCVVIIATLYGKVVTNVSTFRSGSRCK